ncbi:hypothetical protein AAG747_14075 [Rapidithrix thailandica]|uniref:Uncharacterized protein n=1 Tax=Rapidithrix thailandica TaxID=413964 RepID=A0AAW9RZ39_9BACT
MVDSKKLQSTGKKVLFIGSGMVIEKAATSMLPVPDSVKKFLSPALLAGSVYFHMTSKSEAVKDLATGVAVSSIFKTVNQFIPSLSQGGAAKFVPQLGEAEEYGEEFADLDAVAADLEMIPEDSRLLQGTEDLALLQGAALGI